MARLIDLTGKRFGRLRVIRRAKNDKWGNIKWLCKCDCGNKITVRGSGLRDSTTKSCGCLQREIVSAYSKKFKLKHGHAKRNKVTKTYRLWQDMIKRCTDPNCKNYKYYGGRGITVCKRWMKFENFLKDMGEIPEGLSLDRKNNNKNYCKPNCRWATRQQQMRNKRNNIYITYDGKIQLLIKWSKEIGIPYMTLWQRIFKYNWSIEKALTIPAKKREENGRN